VNGLEPAGAVHSPAEICTVALIRVLMRATVQISAKEGDSPIWGRDGGVSPFEGRQFAPLALTLLREINRFWEKRGDRGCPFDCCT
jgi:hypothetical protein